MNNRDYAYIEHRLSAPCQEALEAHGRLIQAREFDLASELMTAMQDFTDVTRHIRLKMFKSPVR